MMTMTISRMMRMTTTMMTMKKQVLIDMSVSMENRDCLACESDREVSGFKKVAGSYFASIHSSQSDRSFETDVLLLFLLRNSVSIS